MLTDEQTYNALNNLIHALAGFGDITIGDMLRQAAVHLQLSENGLDLKQALVKKFVSAIINKGPITDFSDGTSAALPIKYQTALAECSCLFLRKTKAKFLPNSTGSILWTDVNIRELYVNSSVVKHVVDVICGYDHDVKEEMIKACVADGEHEALPSICRPPPTATSVNHFVQMAFIGRDDGKYDIVKWITFESEGNQGEVKTEFAALHGHGQLHYINYGSNQTQWQERLPVLIRTVGWNSNLILAVGGSHQQGKPRR